MLGEQNQQENSTGMGSSNLQNKLTTRWLPEKEFCNSVESDYNSLSEQINRGNTKKIMLELTSFIQKGTESDQRLDRFQRDVKEIYEKFNGEPQTVSFLAFSLNCPDFGKIRFNI